MVAASETAPATWGPVDTRYLHKDHLGSVDVVTDANGAVLERLSFDPWGKRRQIDWTQFTQANPYNFQLASVNRGYTGHEQLDPVGLVHMNGRVYDPEIGRFLSADPFVQDATNSQAFNAYAYVQNNPLSLTDPSGFFSIGGIFKAIGKFFSAIGRAFGHIARAIARSQIGRAILQIAACTFGGPIGCAAAAAGLTLAAGGTLRDAIIGAALAFIQVPGTGSMSAWTGVWGAVGDAVATLPKAFQFAGAVVTHAVVGGALSMAQGGSFLSGAAAGAVGAVGSGLGMSLGARDIVSNTVISAVAGGTASVLTGGKFANGAITAAFAHLYNDENLGGRVNEAISRNIFGGYWDAVQRGAAEAGKEVMDKGLKAGAAVTSAGLVLSGIGAAVAAPGIVLGEAAAEIGILGGGTDGIGVGANACLSP